MTDHDTLSSLAERLHTQRQRKAKRSAYWWFSTISDYVAAFFMAAAGGILIGISYTAGDVVIGVALVLVAMLIVPINYNKED